MPKFNKVHVIINPAAGNNEPILNTLNDVFYPHGIQWDVSLTMKQGDAESYAHVASHFGEYDLIVSYGGDGTVMEVATGMIGSDVPLAILPGGTGNALATEMGISQQLKSAAELICDESHQLRQIDAGKIGERYFFLRAGMGLGVSLVEKADREMKDRFGFLAYAFSALDVIQNPEHATYKLNLDGEEVEYDGIACMIANSGLMGKFNFKLSSKIEPDDGLLDVIVMNDDLDSALAMAASIVERDEYTAALRHWQVKNVRIEVDPPLAVRGDGEEFGETPITIEVVPKAISVVVPAEETED